MSKDKDKKKKRKEEKRRERGKFNPRAIGDTGEKRSPDPFGSPDAPSIEKVEAVFADGSNRRIKEAYKMGVKDATRLQVHMSAWFVELVGQLVAGLPSATRPEIKNYIDGFTNTLR